MAVVLFAIPGGGGWRSGEQVPVPTIEVLEPGRFDDHLTPRRETSYRFVFQEFGATEDKIWRLSPQDPTNREQLAAIQHRENWSVKPSLSPDSRFIAYAVPEGAIDRLSGRAVHADLKLQETALVSRVSISASDRCGLKTAACSTRGACLGWRRLSSR
jgi:hypothetical protein